MANYDYYVDENGKITRKKKKKEEDNIAYVVSEDGTISPYKDRKTAIRESSQPLMDGLKTVGRVTGAVGESMWKGIIGPSLGKMAIGYMAAKQAEKEREEEYPIAAALSNVTQAMGTVGGAVKDFGVGVAATSGDVAGNVVKGFLGGAEGVSDFLSNGVAGVADWIGFDEYAEDVRDRTAENMYGDFIDGLMDDWGITEHSSLGGIPEQVAQGVGQAGFTVATGAFGKMLGMGAKGVSWLSNGTLFASSAGNGMSEAYRDGASDGEAFAYGVTQGTIEVLTERLFGDLGKWTGNAGLGKSFSALDDKAAKAVGQKVAKALGTGKYANAFKNVAEGTVKAGFGGAEEAIAGAGSSVAKWLIYASEEKSLEELAEIVQDENLLEQFIVGALVSGVMQTPDVVKSSKDGTDLISGRTNDEDAVFNKEYEKRIAEEEQGGKKLTAKEKAKIYEAVERDFAEGGISIDTIEETLGGDTYIEYQNAVNEQKALQDEFDTLNKMKQGEMTGEQSDRRNELKQQLEELKNNSKADEIRQRLSEEVKTLVTTPSKSGRNSPLAESYNERERRKHKFVANLSDYDDDEKETIQRAIDSGILNNTRQTHKFVDLLAKLSADKGVSFDFTNNEKLKESGFAVDGRQVNGYVTVNGVTVNINSNKALNTVVGHEITHVLEGTNLYPELQSFLKQYAESKGEYQTRVDAITKLYEGLDADIDAEVTADLVGDYLFTDPDFIQRLSVEHRNVFQKVYDEIKYMAKVATAGSKQARQLEKAMKTFEDIYRESGKAQKNTVTEDGVKYALAGKNKHGIEVYETSQSTMELSWKERKDKYLDLMMHEYRGRTAKFERNGHTYYAQFDQSSLRKPIYGDSRSSRNGVRAVVKAGADGDLFDLVENSQYTRSKKNTKDHTDADYFDYFIKTVQIDGKVFDLVADVEKKYGEDGGYVYTLALVDNKKMEASAALGTPNNGPVKSATNASNEIIAENSEKSSGNSDVKYSLSADSKGRDLSPVVRNRFANTKVVDENGDLKVVYHGTASGEFSIFDKSKGSVEGDFGSGFYFTDDEIDVADHYEDGGPDFDNKIARRAEQIEQEEDIDYEEAEQRAREELYKGGHLFEVYLNIENPAVVGETMLFESDSYYGEYNEEDYDDYDDYVADVDQLIADDIENIVWEVEKNVDVYSTYGLADILFEAVNEGGIGIEELKAKINELYLEDSNGNLVGNEITRQIIESLGYDGIIDHTVSTKWNMDIDENTTHYIVFKPNQIKSVTNENPTDNPDIHRSLSDEGDIAPAIGSYNVYGKDIALEGVPIRDDLAPVQDTVQDTVQPTVQESVFPDDFTPTSEAEANALSDESLDTFTDEDAPPMPETEYDDFSDTTALDPKALKDISKALKDVLYLNNKEVKAIGEVVQKYSTTEFPDKADLFDELQAKFGQKESVERNEETAAIKKTLREYPINVSQAIKKDITDYGAFMRRNFGKVRFSKEGVPVDTAYQDLSSMFPGYFPADITNASDQLMRIAEVAGMEINETETFDLSDEDIMEAVDVIEAEVGKYKEAAVQTAAEADRQAAFAHIDDIAPIRDDIAPVVDIPAPADTSKPIKTVKERLSAKLQNYQTELATNQQQRIDSQASYEEEISRLYAEYSGKKNKNTKAANDILRRIDRLQTMKGNVDADYAKRISDLEAKVAQLTEEVRTGESPTEQAAMRQEVHAAIVDNIKTTFAEKGIDFDKVLANAKDLSTFATVDNTPQRVFEKALGYKEGQILSDLTVNNVAQNETEGIKWLNSFTDRKSGELAKISKRYHIKPGSKESAAAQMYAEGFYVNDNNDIVQYGDAELAKDFPNVTVQARIKALSQDPRIRQIYDETLAAINESRARNGYPEIQRLDNYFLHFRAQTDTFSRLGIPFNPKDIRAKDLPTDLNGVTADLKPGQPYFASAMHRKGKRTSFDLLGGLEQYLTAAKDQIYHIDDIQTLRALRNYIADNYGQAKGLDNLDALTEEEAEAKIKEVFNGHLSTLAKFLNEEANVIAGKTALTDRGLEGVIGRRGITFLADLNKQVGANMVGFNISSSMTNFLATVQGFAKTNKRDFVKGFAQMTANKIKSIAGKGDGFAEQSPVIIRRKGADRFHRTAWQKTSDAGYVLMSAVDNVSTELLARAKYNELTRKGMDAQRAHQETDKWVSRLMGDRSLGQQPQLYNSKMLGMLTKFQLEVRNQLDAQFYDTIKEAQVETEHIENQLKRNSKKAAKITSVFVQLAIGQHLFGKAFESIAGYNPAFDIISVLIKTFGWDDDEDDEDTALDNIEQGFLELLGDLPYTSTFTGGRIPISSALPVEQLVTGKDQYGNEKSRWETVKETAPYYFLPGGYGQIKKTTQGLSMFREKDKPYYYEVDEDGDISKNVVTGSYTDSGNLRYPVEKTFGNVAQAALFGQYANKNAREYFDDERKPLKENQITEYDMLDIPIADYWKYRDGLAKQDTLEEKLDYIDDLDLPIDKKNILANNVANRDSYIDLSDYDDFSGLEEFDFANKNPEKYEFFEQSGITYAAYANGDEDAKRAYNWAYENPEKYIVSQAVASDVVEYRKWASELNDLTGDKDEDGKTINGSRKEKVIDYINHMDADYGAKIILFRTQYKSDDTYNSEIVEYLNSREDITYDEMVTILQELDFKVYPDGTVEW